MDLGVKSGMVNVQGKGKKEGDLEELKVENLCVQCVLTLRKTLTDTARKRGV